MLTAATAGGLALVGVVLGLVGAYLGLVAAYRSHLGVLSDVPVLTLLCVALCAPGAAFLAGWLLGGREPSGIARSVID
jgi:putative ABC transport system permease protein